MANKALNGWRLFWLIALPTSAVMVIAMMRTDLSSAEGVSSMIQLSVRHAVPWLYLAFAASSVQALFPGPFGVWMLRNRKILGLGFAAAMAWQGFFIVWLVTLFRNYYVEEVYVVGDAIEGVVGYLFLVAMTLTSFRFGRRLLSPANWRRLHLVGIYFLWAYAFVVYWWAIFYYPEPAAIDYIYYWAGFLAWGLRAAAWSKKQKVSGGRPQPLFRLTGVLLVGVGLVASATGSLWLDSVETAMTGYSLTQPLDKYLPYWPPVGFAHVLLIATGLFLMFRAASPAEADGA